MIACKIRNSKYNILITFVGLTSNICLKHDAHTNFALKLSLSTQVTFKALYKTIYCLIGAISAMCARSSRYEQYWPVKIFSLLDIFEKKNVIHTITYQRQIYRIVEFQQYKREMLKKITTSLFSILERVQCMHQPCVTLSLTPLYNRHPTKRFSEFRSDIIYQYPLIYILFEQMLHIRSIPKIHRQTNCKSSCSNWNLVAIASIILL